MYYETMESIHGNILYYSVSKDLMLQSRGLLGEVHREHTKVKRVHNREVQMDDILLRLLSSCNRPK